MYLEPKSVDAVFDFITSLSNRKSTIAFDYAVTIPPERIEKYYGYRELSQTMKAPRSGESFKFFIPEGMAEHFLSQRGMTIVKTIDHAQMEKTFLLGRDGRPIGKPNGMFRLAIAKPS